MYTHPDLVQDRHDDLIRTAGPPAPGSLARVAAATLLLMPLTDADGPAVPGGRIEAAETPGQAEGGGGRRQVRDGRVLRPDDTGGQILGVIAEGAGDEHQAALVPPWRAKGPSHLSWLDILACLLGIGTW